MSGPFNESGMQFIRSMEAFDRRHGLNGYSRESLRLLETLNAISPTAYERTLLSDERALRESLVERLHNIQPYIDAWSRIADVPYLEDLARLTAQWDALANLSVDSDRDDSITVELSDEFASALTSVAPYVPAEQKDQYEEALQQAGERRITLSDAIAFANLLIALIIGILTLWSSAQSTRQILESNQQVVESNERVIEAIERHTKVVEQNILAVEHNAEAVEHNTLAIERVAESNLQVIDAIHELLRANVELLETVRCDEQDNSLSYHGEQ